MRKFAVLLLTVVFVWSSIAIAVRAEESSEKGDNSGSQAVSITPSLRDGCPVAAVTLVKNDNFKTISSLLD
jgi:hypothetical protein